MMPWYLGNSSPFVFWIIPLAIWSVIWTGLALWHAAVRREKWWFIFFLFVHTAGIVEIFYLLLVAKAIGQKQSSRRRSR